MKIYAMTALRPAFLAGAVLVVGAWFAGVASAQEFTPKTLAEKKSYLIGFNIGKTLRGQMLTPDLKVVLRGILAGMQGGKSKLSEEETQKTLLAIQKEIAEKYKQAGEAFLAKNKTQPDIVTTESGLQYKVLIKKQFGRPPKASDNVTVHIRATRIDGTAFIDTYQAKKPSEVRIDDMFKGFREALRLMKVGEKWRFFIPTNLAFGAKPPPGIPPNATLIYEVELLKVN